MSADMALAIAGRPAAGTDAPSGHLTPRDAARALRDDVATLRRIARHWRRTLPDRADARIDIALLEMIAGDAEGFAGTMEETA